eukprot:NODE_1304_length_2529_cov_6.793505.p1 GENE.NODE_1304_length_2529_cov_6.793505~~NODE_1304_length_2529_cov_6.793505.p1  ORF type:complete len:735 (-),score=135.15 NODE_1304_length_2529_cov_6.793505:324-2465(-)
MASSVMTLQSGTIAATKIVADRRTKIVIGHSSSNRACQFARTATLWKNCTSWDETSSESEASDAVMIATHISQSFFSVDGSFETGNMNVTNHFVKKTHRWNVGFTYSQFVPSAGLFTSDDTHSSLTDSLTVIVDGDGSVLDTFEPGTTLQMSWHSLLAASGDADMLSWIISEAGANNYPGSEDDGPIARIPGVEVLVYIDCTNNDDKREADEVDWDGTLCVLHVEAPAVQKLWLFYERTYPYAHGRAARLRRYHGLRIAVAKRADVYYVAIGAVWAWAVSLIVILKIPLEIVEFVATKMLGQLSAIYKGALHEVFNLERELAAVPVEICNSTACFYELMDRREGLSRDGFTTHMVDALKSVPGMSSAELGRLVNLCFDAMVKCLNADERPIASLKEQIRAVVHRNMSKSIEEAMETAKEEDRLVDVDDYLLLHMLHSRLCFPDLVSLFDSDRSMSLLERWFMPAFVLRADQATEHQQEQIAEVVERLKGDPLHHHPRRVSETNGRRPSEVIRDASIPLDSLVQCEGPPMRSASSAEVEKLRDELNDACNASCNVLKQVRLELQALQNVIHTDVLGKPTRNGEALQDGKAKPVSLKDRIDAIEAVLESHNMHVNSLTPGMTAFAVAPNKYKNRQTGQPHATLQSVETISEFFPEAATAVDRSATKRGSRSLRKVAEAALPAPAMVAVASAAAEAGMAPATSTSFSGSNRSSHHV